MQFLRETAFFLNLSTEIFLITAGIVAYYRKYATIPAALIN